MKIWKVRHFSSASSWTILSRYKGPPTVYEKRMKETDSEYRRISGDYHLVRAISWEAAISLVCTLTGVRRQYVETTYPEEIKTAILDSYSGPID